MIRADITVYFIRHGQTDWNAARRYQGQKDVPLNSLGRDQALRNGEALAKLLPAIAEADFVSSPLGRARETMEIVRRAMNLDTMDYRLEPALKEINYGHWEGILASEMPVADPAGLAARRNDPFNWRPVGGESYADLGKRASDWLQSVRRNTVAASHGGIGRTLRRLVLDLDPLDTLRLDAPQDRIMIVRRGEVDWL